MDEMYEPERDDIPALENSDEALADKETGFQAGLGGAEFDESQTPAWQIGWANAQE